MSPFVGPQEMVYIGLGFGVLLVPVAIGIGLNLLVRFGFNQVDWQKADVRFIWWEVAALVFFPVLGVLVMVVSENVFFAFFYLLWLAGYLWAWFDSRFERGKGDVIMVKTLILARVKFEMWWQKRSFERQLRKLR